MKPRKGLDDLGPFLIFPAGGVGGVERSLRIDFLNDPKYRRQLRGKNELLAKALGGAGPAPGTLVYDLTLGLAEDAWTMLRLGFRVLGAEREPLLAELLVAAQLRAAADPKWGPMAARLEVHSADGLEILAAAKRGEVPRPDVVYIDPMFSGVAKKSALPGLDMQLMRAWLGDADALDLKNTAELATAGARLVDEALVVARKRVVVKRLAKATALAPGVNHAFEGGKVRYDMYLSRGGSA